MRLEVAEARVQIQRGTVRQRISERDIIITRLDDDGARKRDGFVSREDGGGVVTESEGLSRRERRTIGEHTAVRKA